MAQLRGLILAFYNIDCSPVLSFYTSYCWYFNCIVTWNMRTRQYRQRIRTFHYVRKNYLLILLNFWTEVWAAVTCWQSTQIRTGEPGFEARQQNTMCVNGTWCMQNPVQCPPCSHSKLCLRWYQSGEAIPSEPDQNCNGMSPDHP